MGGFAIGRPRARQLNLGSGGASRSAAVK